MEKKRKKFIRFSTSRKSNNKKYNIKEFDYSKSELKNSDKENLIVYIKKYEKYLGDVKKQFSNLVNFSEHQGTKIKELEQIKNDLKLEKDKFSEEASNYKNEAEELKKQKEIAGKQNPEDLEKATEFLNQIHQIVMHIAGGEDLSDKEAERYQKLMVDLENTINKIFKEKNLLIKEKEKLKEETDVIKKTLEDQTESLNQYLDQNAILKTEIKEIAQKNDQKINADKEEQGFLENTNKKISEENEKLLNEIAKLTDQIKHINDENQDLKKYYEEKNKEFIELGKNFSETQMRLREVETKYNSLKEKYASSKKGVIAKYQNELKRQKSILEEEYKKKMEVIKEDGEGEISNTEDGENGEGKSSESTSRFRKEVEDLSEKLKTLQDENINLQSKVRILEEENQKIEEEKLALEDQAESKNKELEELNTINKDLKTKRQAGIKEINSLRKKLGNIAETHRDKPVEDLGPGTLRNTPQVQTTRAQFSNKKVIYYIKPEKLEIFLEQSSKDLKKVYKSIIMYISAKDDSSLEESEFIVNKLFERVEDFKEYFEAKVKFYKKKYN